jgi:inhibitor of Bruton tyrosine kinase
MALGADGTLILCTESGHVFVRSRNAKLGNSDKRRQQLQPPSQSQSTKLFKFQRIPFLQRIVKVCSNSTGAFAALRQEVKPTPIGLCGNSLNDDLAAVRPFVVHPTHHSLHIDDSHQITSIGSKVSAMNLSEDLDDTSDEDSDAVTTSIRSLSQLLGVLTAGKSESLTVHDSHGSDTIICCEMDFPVHSAILIARCPALLHVFQGHAIENSNIRIVPCAVEQRVQVFGCHALAVLLLLHYIYADDVPAFWDRRVSEAMNAQLSSAGIVISTIKTELRNLARILQLEPLRDVLDSITIRALKPTLATDMEILFNSSQGEISSPNPRGFQHPSARDILIQLADREVACHSFLLRARSPFFASFLGDKEWTSRRWKSGLLHVNFEHLQWKPMAFVFKYLYQGMEISIFDGIGRFLLSLLY